eukprot:5173661-Ditylum_brightwellii.AAC.1
MVALSDQAELVRWHYRLQHLSFRKLNMLAKVGLLPRRLGQVQPPSCVHCIYGSMTRRPWQGKQALTTCYKIKPAHRAGQCISVDQMESTVPGFVAQLTED